MRVSVRALRSSVVRRETILARGTSRRRRDSDAHAFGALNDAADRSERHGRLNNTPERKQKTSNGRLTASQSIRKWSRALIERFRGEQTPINQIDVAVQRIWWRRRDAIFERIQDSCVKRGHLHRI